MHDSNGQFIEGLWVQESKIFTDNRGWLFESFNYKQFSELIGLDVDFVQDNHSYSHKSVLRGMHYQVTKPQGKLLRVTAGRIYDVVVDLRQDSLTYSKWFGIEISASNHRQIWIPPGVAHGFLVLSDAAEVLYKMTEYFDPQSEVCLAWNDPTIAIEWPLPPGVLPNVNAKDAAGLAWDAIPKF
jgi:dTDP-4-dehydrorhamnose 3,5-epimerase